MLFIAKTVISKIVFLIPLIGVFVTGFQLVLPTTQALRKPLTSTTTHSASAGGLATTIPARVSTTTSLEVTHTETSLPTVDKTIATHTATSVTAHTPLSSPTAHIVGFSARTGGTSLVVVHNSGSIATITISPASSPTTTSVESGSTPIVTTTTSPASSPTTISAKSGSTTVSTNHNTASGVASKISLSGPTGPIKTSQSFTISGIITDTQGNPVANGTVVSISDGQLEPIVILAPKVGSSAPVAQPSYSSVDSSTVTKDGSFSFTQALSTPGTYSFRVYCGKVDAYLTVVVIA